MLKTSLCIGAMLCALSVPLQAQDRDQVGLAIAQACGQLDESSQGVLAGTVRDTQTGVPLDGAAVVILWQEPGRPAPASETLRADGEGFFLFCGAPHGRALEVSAEALGRRSESRTIEIEAGTLVIEHIQLPVSDPEAPGFVTGTVVDVGTKGGIFGVEVRVRETDVRTLTNDRGLFVLERMPYGIYVLELTHIAYQDREIPLRVAGGLTQNVRVEMSEEAMEIEGLTVSVEPRQFYNAMDGFVRRMEVGFGDFLTRVEIERSGASRLPELLVGVAGVRLAENGRALVIRGRPCTPMVFLDGRQYRLDDDLGLNDILAFDIEALEFYKGTAGIPAEFNFSTNGQTGCGAVVVWTRRGR